MVIANYISKTDYLLSKYCNKIMLLDIENYPKTKKPRNLVPARKIRRQTNPSHFSAHVVFSLTIFIKNILLFACPGYILRNQTNSVSMTNCNSLSG